MRSEFDLKKFENACYATQYRVKMLRGLAIAWFDQREEVLCALSIEDEYEWPNPDTLRIAGSRLDTMVRLMTLMQEMADEPQGLLEAVLDDVAKEHGFVREIDWMAKAPEPEQKNGQTDAC